ncbi:MAG: NAD(P)-dependent oxidoreductase [Promethearchaeota archaeon]
MRILVTASFHDDGLAILRKHADVVYEDWRITGRVYWGEELLEKLRKEKANAVIVEADAVTDDVIDAIELKFIGCARDTPKEVDVDAATRKRIPVFYAPGRNADSVADLAILLMLSQARHIIKIDRALKSGSFHVDDAEQLAKMQESLQGFELGRKIIGIIGLGQIGSRVAERLRGFGSRILYYDPYIPSSRGAKLGAKSVDLKTLLSTADIITIHTHATPETFRMIGREQLSWMKPTAHIINTARSAIIDEDALFEALKEGKLGGAALDVQSREPISSDNRFLILDNVTVTPHIGGNTSDVIYRQSLILSKDIEQFLKGKKPKHLANPDVLKT